GQAGGNVSRHDELGEKEITGAGNAYSTSKSGRQTILSSRHLPIQRVILYHLFLKTARCSPVLFQRGWNVFTPGCTKSTSVVCISHTSAFRNFLIPSLRLGISKTLWPIFMGCPFPGVWHHCLLAWYYGGSVAMRLATFRRSRFCVSETLSVFRCLFVPS